MWRLKLRIVGAYGCWAGTIIAVFLAALYFSPGLSVWLAILAATGLWRLEATVSLLLLTAPIDTVGILPGAISISFSELELAIVVLVTGAALLSGRAGAEDNRPLWWGLPFCSAVVISGFMNLESYKVIPHLLRMGEIFVAMWLAANTLGTKSGRRAFLFVLVSSALLLPAVGVFQVIFNPATPARSFLGNANQLSLYLNFFLPFLAVRVSRSVDASSRTLWAGLLGLNLLAQALTFSRSGWLSAIVVLACCGLLESRSARLRLRPVLTTIALIALTLGALTFWFSAAGQRGVASRLSASLGLSSISESAELRLNLLRLGVDVWSDHLVTGVGPGRYPKVYPAYAAVVEEPARKRFESRVEGNSQQRVQRVERRLGFLRRMVQTHVHNLYLQLAVELGLLGLVGFLIFLGLTMRALWQEGGPWAVSALSLLAGFLTHNLLDCGFPSLGLELGLFLGLAMGRLEANDTAAKESSTAAPPADSSR